MQEDNFFNELDFASLRDCSGGPEVNQYQVYLDEAAIKGKKEFLTNDEDKLTLFHKPAFLLAKISMQDHLKLAATSAKDGLLEEYSAVLNFDEKPFEFILIGDEYIEGINDPDELEDALNSWGVY